MTRSIESDTTLLRLSIVILSTFLLAGAAVLVSANAQIPVAGTQRLLTLSADAKAEQEAFFAENTLSQEKLKALKVLHSIRDLQQPAALRENTPFAHFQSNKPLDANKPLDINVNTFLLSARLSNDSQLAELQMQPAFSEFDSQLFLNNKETDLSSGFAGVGFPHIETNNRPDAERYKPYKQLLSFTSDEHGDIVPHVKCMGLSPERVAQRAKKYDGQIFKLAVQYNVSASLVKAVVAKESCYNPKARSYVGAIGLMQLMPETAKWLKVKQPENPDQNLAAGVRYLAQLRKRFGSNELALAAYNAGPGNVERYKGIPPFDETQNYVRDVMHFYRGYVATTRFVNALNSFE